MEHGYFYFNRSLLQDGQWMLVAPGDDVKMYLYLYHLAKWRNTESLMKGDVKTTYDDLKSKLKKKIGYREKRFSTKEIYKILERLEKQGLVSLEKTKRMESLRDAKENYGATFLKRKNKNEIVLTICNYVGSEEAKAIAYSSRICNVSYMKGKQRRNNTLTNLDNEIHKNL